MEEHEKQAIPEDNTEAVKGTKHSTAKPSKRRKNWWKKKRFINIRCTGSSNWCNLFRWWFC